jgi:hypothetical protein
METKRPESTNQPTSVDPKLSELPIAECQEKLTKTLSDDGLTGASFVAACAVRVGTAHIEVLLPLLNADGSLSDKALRVTERLFTDTLAVLPLVRRLPVKSLSHEDVAVVTRSSLERLAQAARAIIAPGACAFETDLGRDVAAALEPFALVGVPGNGAN